MQYDFPVEDSCRPKDEIVTESDQQDQLALLVPRN